MASQNSSKWQPLMARNRGANLLVLWSSWDLPNSAWCFGTMEFYVPFHIWDVIHWRTPSFFKMGTLHHQPAILFHSFLGIFLAHGIRIMMIMKNVRILGSSPMNSRLNVLGVCQIARWIVNGLKFLHRWMYFLGWARRPRGPRGRLWVINHWQEGW